MGVVGRKKYSCKYPECNNGAWKICEHHFKANSFVNERKDRLNTDCVPKPYHYFANEDFVVVDVISLHSTTLTQVCKGLDQKPYSHSQDSEIMDSISSFHLQDHNYCGTGESEVLTNKRKFAIRSIPQYPRDIKTEM
jgi:hypothetical protein